VLGFGVRPEVMNMRPAKEFRVAREALLSFVVCFC